ncbi:MAG: RNA polymerase sporulation sigma factor SigH [Clostridia bacterium]|nr:RNA polymerase sporulation sigma factor SigH [Clostridia bacterium]
MSTQGSFDNMTDEEIVIIAQSGNEEALDFILHKFRPHVARKANSYFLAGADKDDIIQEGMIGLFKAVRDYKTDKDAAFRSFAELCITRQIISAVKSASRLKHSPLNSYISLDKPIQDDNYDSTLLDIIAAGGASNPEDIIIGRENMEQVEIKMEEVLSRFECEVLSLYLTGKSYNEISAILKKDSKSIDNALQRIKKKFEKFSDTF